MHIYTLSCRDLGHEDCVFVADGKTGAQAVHKMVNHMRIFHIDILDDMSDDELNIRLTSQVKTTKTIDSWRSVVRVAR